MGILKYVILAVMLIIGTASASDLKRIELSENQIHAVLKNSNKLEYEASPWAVTGYEIWNRSHKCLEKRKITIYAKPKSYNGELTKSDAVVLTFQSDRDSHSKRCYELMNLKETRLVVAEFGNYVSSKDMRNYFEVRGEVTDKELIYIINILKSVQKCLSNSDCDSLSIRNAFSNEKAKLQAISAKNIASIEKLPMSVGGRTYMVIFKSYSEDKLAVFISDAYSKVHRIDISAVIP